MVTKPFIIILLMMILLQTKTFSQDPEFSQFYGNPLYLNPALTGATVCPRMIGNFRDQWPSIGGAFVTYSVSYDQYVDFLHGGLGVNIVADRTGGGNLNTTTFNLLYAYKFNVTSKLSASTAVEVGYYQRHLAFENLTFEDMIDPRAGFTLPTSEKAPDNETVGVPDFSAGIAVGYDEKYYGGVAVAHLTQPKNGFYADNNSTLPMKITVHGGAIINLKQEGYGEDREFSLSPNILYQQQDNFKQLNLGLYLTIDPFIGGLWFRYSFENPDAIIPFLGIHFQSLRVGYSYDYTVSNLRGATGGAHEIAASWQFPCVEKRRHIRAIKCPRF